MDSNTKNEDGAGAPHDVLVARAMNRVLESEHSAQEKIAACERECAEIVERARQQRRATLERAHARIVALHTRAAKALEARSAQILERGRESAASVVERLADPARRRAAIERLAAELTGNTLQQPQRGD